jgi:lysophospholipase L1-like esterase
VQVLDLNHQLCPQGKFTWSVNGVQVRSDGVHLTPAGVSQLTPWLVDRLKAAVR